MNRRDEEWLKTKILEDMNAMAEEQEKTLRESEELQGITMSEEKLQEIYEELERRQQARDRKRIRKFRLKASVALAAVLIMVIGVGLVGSGKKVYIPVISQKERGEETTTKINNSEVSASEYNDETVCQEIEEKLGVYPIRLGYRPKGMKLFEYWIKELEREAVMKYDWNGKEFQIYISKDLEDTSINFQVDGEKIDTIMIESNGIEVEAYEYEDPNGIKYYGTSFEYLNTYYFVSGMMETEEFKKILENITIKNA